ncbi:putative ADP-ribosylation factor-like protein 13B [Hypsibius exemplaris]|uniref:ADP-ribosylation factor-like protein 13B n=1 Tax=Hypsibius exemplaris TaxID=2072580 RepID=A0A1W0X0J6_HYPEX|nr:putative ADP-ribosylation factor-like protein 13B [Hypsibius exemplaris]
MGNSVSFGGSLPCTCLHGRGKVVPAPDDEAVHVAGNGRVSVGGGGGGGEKPLDANSNHHRQKNGNGTTGKSSNGTNGKAGDGSSASAFINSASLASPLLQTYARETFPLCLLLIGLDGAGKTSFMQWVTQRYPVMGRGRQGSKSGMNAGVAVDYSDATDPRPTMGFSKEEVRFKKHPLVMHDLGGGKSIRGIWKNYYAEAHGIVLVADGSLPLGNERWDELNEVLEGMIASDDSGLQSRPLLVLLNKQDENSCISADDFKSFVKIADLAEEYSMPFRVVPVCLREKRPILNAATKAQVCSKAVEESIQWVVKGVEIHFPILHMKVQQDTRAQVARDEQLRRDRTARLKAAREAQEAKEIEEEGHSAAENPDVDPFIPLGEHLERVEQRRSSLAPSHELSASVAAATKPGKSVIPASRSEPNVSSSRVSDDFSASDILMDDGDCVRLEDRRQSSQELRSFSGGDNAPSAGSIGDISDAGSEERVRSPRLKTSRPPVYKRQPARLRSPSAPTTVAS